MALLFLRSSSGPVLIIKRQTNPEMIMINFKDAAETRLLYNSLSKKLNSSEMNREVGTSTDKPIQYLSQLSGDNYGYPPEYPKFEILCDNQQLSWLKGDSNFTGEPGGMIGNTMFGMNEEHTNKLRANIVKPESKLIFTAAVVPGLNNPEYKLDILDNDNLFSTYPLNKNTMLTPKEEGEYVFALSVDWGNGDNSISYWFKLRVNS